MALVMASAIIAVGSFPACQRISRTDQSSRKLTKLNVRLGWLVNANSAGQIIALARGYYRSEGLDVTFHEGGLTDPSVKTVAGGADEFGFANSPDLVISARAAGAPLKIIAVIQSEGYHGFFTREDSGIITPQDWIGRRVGIKIGSPTYLYYTAILEQQGIDRSSIHEIPVTYDLRPFVDREVDVLPGALNNEGIALQSLGIRLRTLSPSTYGIPTMGNVVFTTDATLRDRAEIAQRFLRATIRGWDWCRLRENRDLAVHYLVSYNPRLDPTKERRALDETLRLVGDGSIDKNKLASIIEIQTRFGGLARIVTVDELAFPVPTK